MPLNSEKYYCFYMQISYQILLKEYACYAGDVKNFKRGEDLSDQERKKCTDLSLVLGDSW